MILISEIIIKALIKFVVPYTKFMSTLEFFLALNLQIIQMIFQVHLDIWGLCQVHSQIWKKIGSHKIKYLLI